jgi:hypothetical protein
MADKIWKGYRNGKGSLKIGKKFILPGAKIPEDLLKKMEQDDIEVLEVQGCIVDDKVVEDIKPVESPSTETGKKKKKSSGKKEDKK